MKSKFFPIVVFYLFIGNPSEISSQIDTTYFNDLIIKYYKAVSAKIDSAKYYLTLADEYADSVNYSHGVIECKYYNAYIASREGEIKKSIEIAKSGIELCDSDEFLKLKSNLLRFIGIRYKNMQDRENAKKYFNLSLKDALALNDSIGLSNIYFNLATFYEENNEFDKSIDCYNKSREIDFALGKLKYVASTYNNMAILLKKMGDMEKAKSMVKKAISISKSKNNKYDLIQNYSTLASIYYSNDSIDKSLIYYKKADEIANQIGSKKMRLSTQYNLATIYVANKQSKEALKYLDEAEKLAINSIKLPKIKIAKSRAFLELGYYNESEKIFSELKEIVFDKEKELKQTYFKLGKDIYLAKNDYKTAFNYLNKVKTLSDTLNKEIEKKYVLETEAKFQNKIKEAENKTLLQQNQLKEEKIKTQRMMMAFGGLGLLLLSGLLFVIYRQKKKQKKLNEVLADRNIKISLISREIAHRAKNQLALATNLISYQKNKAEDIGAKQLIEESENKLKALSAVNKRLSDDDELARVNLKDVVEEVVANNIYSLAISNIDYNISLPNTAIDSNKMSLIALIINELTTNSIKHAFRDNPNPKITVEGTIKDDKFTMKYKDNGNIKTNIKSEGLGQSLITGLVNQLQGIYKIDVSLGFVFDLNIPI